MADPAASSRYDRRRSFERTPEPPGEATGGDVDPFTAPLGDRFVIQQHYATRLHHDLRLEMLAGSTPVLVSWAVPKGLPRRHGVRALAIRTEDHPIGYATFSGTIPEGSYGAGEVRIFDEGHYQMLDREEGKLTFRLEGRRLQGDYHLVRTGEERGKEQWLGLLGEDRRPEREPPPPPDPMLATLVDQPFDDEGWGFEPKWDGIRALAVCNDHTSLVSRNRNDVTAAYPELGDLHERLVALDAILDGEIVAMAGGAPSFQRLQSRMHVRDPREVERLARATPVTYVAFDLLYLDGRDLTGLPLTERREVLEQALVPSHRVQVSPLLVGEGRALYQAALERGMEGIVAKRLTSRYEAGKRSRAWRKVKGTFEADLVVAGWKEGEGRREGTLGSLVLGAYDDGDLRYVGSVGSGFDDRSLPRVLALLRERRTDEPPFPPAVLREARDLRRAHWVRPELVAAVEFRQLTEGGRLRAPVFRGLRDDKAPEECRYDLLRAPAG